MTARALLAALLVLLGGPALAQPPWLIAAPEPRPTAGQPFELVVVGPAAEALPDRLEVRFKTDSEDIVATLQAGAPAESGRRLYTGSVPRALSGTISVSLVGRDSNTLLLAVAGGERKLEPPLSEDDPMYFVVGHRQGWTARFQLSFKYRLFDLSSGYGREHPWLSGFYFGYTQSSIWDLSSASRVFHDTSYRPSLFWRWERLDQQTFIDGLRAGLEHESNGRGGVESRSINIAFVRPEWRFALGGGRKLELAPKLYAYLDKSENPDIQHYRGYADWRMRYDDSGEWIVTAELRRGTAGKGSALVGVSKRARDLRFGSVGGYYHVQLFDGWGEDILDYNVRRPAQLRFGFAIVP